MTYKHGNRQESTHVFHGMGEDEREDAPAGTPISWKEDRWTYCMSDSDVEYHLFHSMKLEGDGCEKAGYNDIMKRVPLSRCPAVDSSDIKFDQFLYDLGCTKLEDGLIPGILGIYVKGPVVAKGNLGAVQEGWLGGGQP